MIRNLLIIFALGLCSLSNAQDTIQRYPGAYGCYTLTIVDGADTTYYNYLPDSTLESTKLIVNGQHGFYTRYYPSGKVMWTQERSKGKANGSMKFFGKDGVHLATLILENDSITATPFIHRKRKIIFGRYTYYSIVYGGMEPVDGGSNISGGHGVGFFTDFYLVKLKPGVNAQSKYSEFTTDYNGYFFSEVDSGKYGIFPYYFPIEKVQAPMGTPGYGGGNATETNWNFTDPIEMTDTNYRYLFLHFHSVGYAP